MLKRKLLLASALVGAELIAGACSAQAGGVAGMTHTVNVGSVANRLAGVNCRNFGSSKPISVYGSGGSSITNNVNRATNINVNKSLNVYSPVNVTNNIDTSTNITNNVNINNSKTIDNSTNITVNKDINVRTTNIFNGMGSGNTHSQGGTWGSQTGNMGGGSHSGGGAGGSNQNNNNNDNQNSNGNENNNDNSSHVHNTNTVNNSNSIDASGAINAFFNGLRGFQ